MDFRRVIGSRQGQNLLFRNLFHTLNTCGDGSTFVQTQHQAAYRGGVESGRAGFDCGGEQGYL